MSLETISSYLRTYGAELGTGCLLASRRSTLSKTHLRRNSGSTAMTTLLLNPNRPLGLGTL